MANPVLTPALFAAIRNDVDPNFAARIPTSTQQSLEDFAIALAQTPVQYNQFVAALVNRIGTTILRNTTFANPMASLKRGTMAMGQTIQEVHISPSKSEGAYDPAGLNPLGRRVPPRVDVAYHVMNRQDQYVITLDNTMFMQNFRSWDRVEDFVRRLMNSIYVGAAWDEYLAMRQVMTIGLESTDPGKILPSSNIGTINPRSEEDGKKFVQALKYVVSSLGFMTTDYTQAGVPASAQPSDLVLFANKDLLTNIDVYALSGVFNLEKVAIPTSIFKIDTFGVDNVMGIVAGREWLMNYDVLNSTEPIRNPQGIFSNFFHNVWQNLGLSPYAPCMVLRAQA